MKPATRPRIDTSAISVFLTELALWMLDALAFVGCERLLRRHITTAVIEFRRALFVRAVAQANFHVCPAKLSGLRQYQPHKSVSDRATMRAVLGKTMPGLLSGSTKLRLTRLKHALRNADAIVAKILRRVQRVAGWLHDTRLIVVAPPGALGAPCTLARPLAHIPDTS